MQPKLKCIESSEDNASSITDLEPDAGNQNGEKMNESSTDHQLSLIHSTERKKWPQKKCVYCRRKFGLRNDTRYICIQCNVAVCKPCFSDYHCNKNS